MFGSAQPVGRAHVPLTVPTLFDAVVREFGSEECLVHGEQRLSWNDLSDRVRRFAGLLNLLGVGVQRPRSELQNWQSGQDHVALILRNGVEYIQCMVGAFSARAVPFNVNFRYTAEELCGVIGDAKPKVIVVGSEFAATTADAVNRSTGVELVLQVRDGSGQPRIGDHQWFDEAVNACQPAPVDQTSSPDDLYMLFTGGTTGKPKGVLWGQADIMISGFGLGPRGGGPFASVDDALDHARSGPRRVGLPVPPFVHGAAQWLALGYLLAGNRIVIQDDVVKFDPDDVLDTASRERVTELMVVGDAFGRPLVDAMERHPRDLRSLRAIVNGGAALSAGVRDRMFAAFPGVRIVDSMGSSESGRQATRSLVRGRARAADESPRGNGGHLRESGSGVGSR